MNKFEMLKDISEKIHEPFYDELNDYLKGVRDLLNFLEPEIASVNPDEVYEYIISQYEKVTKLKIKHVSIDIDMYESEYNDFKQAEEKFCESFSSLDYYMKEKGV